jgi:succinyl-diaminopimelate desuccinylase
VKIDIHWNKPIGEQSSLEFRHFVGGERANIVPNRAEITWLVLDGQAVGVSSSLKIYLEEYLKSNPKADAFPLRIDTDLDSGLKQLHITFLGKSAHGSRPHDGHNAILDALRFFAGVPQLPRQLVRVSEFLARSCEDLDGEGLGIAGEHSFIGKTTCNLGVLRIDAGGAAATINIRPTLGMSVAKVVESVRARVSAWAAAHDMRAEVQPGATPHEALYVDPEKHPELIGALQEAYTRVTGKKATLLSKGGTTFAKAFPNAVSFGPVNPAEEEDLGHQADECVRVDHLLRNARIYGHALFLLSVDYKATIRRNHLRGMGIGP